MNCYTITYKNGLMNRTTVYANDEVEAAKMGLAEYRKNSGWLETVDTFPIEKVVDKVELANF